MKQELLRSSERDFNKQKAVTITRFSAETMHAEDEAIIPYLKLKKYRMKTATHSQKSKQSIDKITSFLAQIANRQLT
jgi:hypothetical protein